MASLRAASSNSATTGTAISVSAPTGTAAGDVVEISVHANTQTTIVDNNGSTPFLEVINDYKPNTTNGHTVSIFTRRIQSGDPSTYNFTSGATGRWSIVAGAWQNPESTQDTADSYSESNSNTTRQLNATTTRRAQSFTPAADTDISSIKWLLSKSGSPTGAITVNLYTHSGTFGTSSVPTGTALATAISIDASALTTTQTLTEFTFAQPYRLLSGTNYLISIEFTGDASNFLLVGTDTTSPTHGGNTAFFSAGSWAADNTQDHAFYVYGTKFYDVYPSTTNAANADDSLADTIDAPAITTLSDNAIHVVYGYFDDGAGSDPSGPSGYTTIDTDNDEPQGGFYKVITSAGSTGAQTVTGTTSSPRIALSHAIKNTVTASTLTTTRLLLTGVGI